MTQQPQNSQGYKMLKEQDYLSTDNGQQAKIKRSGSLTVFSHKLSHNLILRYLDLQTDNRLLNLSFMGLAIITLVLYSG